MEKGYQFNYGKRLIIRRVFEGGNDQEKEEVTRFYGKEVVEAILKSKE